MQGVFALQGRYEMILAHTWYLGRIGMTAGSSTARGENGWEFRWQYAGNSACEQYCSAFGFRLSLYYGFRETRGLEVRWRNWRDGRCFDLSCSAFGSCGLLWLSLLLMSRSSRQIGQLMAGSFSNISLNRAMDAFFLFSGDFDLFAFISVCFSASSQVLDVLPQGYFVAQTSKPVELR